MRFSLCRWGVTEQTGGRRFSTKLGSKKFGTFPEIWLKNLFEGPVAVFVFVFFSQEGLCFLNRHLFFEVIREIVVLCCERMLVFF